MTVSDAVEHRQSIRAFLPEPVDAALLRDLIARAARAPSGGNIQPWMIHVLTGTKLDAFKAQMQERLGAGARETMEYDIYPTALTPDYRERTFACGEALYAALGIAREDKAARRAQFANNFQFFGAPVGLFCFVDRQMGPPQWSDLGMYLQTLMLLLTEHGLGSCAQECWAVYPQTVASFVGAPPEQMLFCGMAIGHPDGAAPANQARIGRVPLDQFATFHDA